MVCIPNSILFIRFQVSSRNSVSQAKIAAKGLCNEGTAELAEKASENQAEVEAEIHVEEANAAE